MATINGPYKAECITTVFQDSPSKTIADVEYATAGWVDWYEDRSSTRPWVTSRPSSTSKLTTLPSTGSRTRRGTAENLGRLTAYGSTD